MEFDKWIEKEMPRRRGSISMDIEMRQAWEAGVKNEREACAKLCDAMNTHSHHQEINDAADAIRMRSNA